jgi:hypothetical protein
MIDPKQLSKLIRDRKKAQANDPTKVATQMNASGVMDELEKTRIEDRVGFRSMNTAKAPKPAEMSDAEYETLGTHGAKQVANAKTDAADENAMLKSNRAERLKAYLNKLF